MDNDEVMSRRHYAEIYKKLTDDGLHDLAHRVKTFAGLTGQEINGAVGYRYWDIPDDKVLQQRYWVGSMLDASRRRLPPAALPPPPQPAFRMHYAEICRKLARNCLTAEAVEVQRIFHLTPHQILGATAGFHFWAQADEIVAWADSLLTPPLPPSPIRRRRRRTGSSLPPST